MRSTRQSIRTSAALALPCAVERVAFAALPAVARVQVLPATRDQVVVTHSGEPCDLPAVRPGEWFARVAAPRRRLADQPDLVRLDLLLFHDVDKSIALRVYVKPIRSVLPDARPRLKTAREGNTPSKLHFGPTVTSPACRDNLPQTRIAAFSSINAVNFSSARTMRHFPLSRCASAIQIVCP